MYTYCTYLVSLFSAELLAVISMQLFSVFSITVVNAVAPCRGVTFPASSCPPIGSGVSVLAPLSVSILSWQAMCQWLWCTRGPQPPRRLLLGLLTVLGLRPPVRTHCVNSPSLLLFVFSSPSVRLVALFISVSHFQSHHHILPLFCCVCGWVCLLDTSLKLMTFTHPIIFEHFSGDILTFHILTKQLEITCYCYVLEFFFKLYR